MLRRCRLQQDPRDTDDRDDRDKTEPSLGARYLEQQDELGEPLDGLHHQAVERDAVRTRLLGLLWGQSGGSPSGRRPRPGFQAVHSPHQASQNAPGEVRPDWTYGPFHPNWLRNAFCTSCHLAYSTRDWFWNQKVELFFLRVLRATADHQAVLTPHRLTSVL